MPPPELLAGGADRGVAKIHVVLLAREEAFRTRVASAGRFGLALFHAFANPYGLEEARALMRERLAQRTETFLALGRTVMDSHPDGPYRWLLDCAGYTWDGLSALVRARGLEAALAQLAAAGVYLDINEFKGKKPVVRRGRTRHVSPTEVDMAQGASVPIQSSGTSGQPTSSLFGIASLKLQASFVPLVVDVLDASRLPAVLYFPFSTGLAHLLTFTLAGFPPAAWFSQIPVVPAWRPPDRRLFTPRLAAFLRWIRLPVRRFADVHHPVPLARWLQQHCPQGALIGTFPGSALRLVRAARSEGIPLPPLTFSVGGEPITERKRTLLEEAGHRVFPIYGSVETGRIALGCLRPRVPDDMHVLVDRLAVIGISRPELRAADRETLLITSLSPDAHKFLLNVETGDSGTLETRSCSCPWERLGLPLHVHSVRSFEKLTPEGMTFMAGILEDLVETILPARFGGSAADYQFAEEERTDGLTQLVLLVDPTIPAEEHLLLQTTMNALRTNPGVDGMLELLERASTLTIRRESPHQVSGKILPLR